MDLSKAFDCLPHSLLITKLRAYGLTIPACELVASYLTDRRQRVKIGNSRGDWRYLEKEVPQGSILGPLLFNIFLNDLFYFIEKCILYNFADDNSLADFSFNIEDLLNNLQHDSKICIEWFTKNGMEANPTKFNFMILSDQPVGNVEISITENVKIVSESIVKVLGVFIDSRLTFNEHVKHSCVKAARQVKALARISKFINFKARKLIFQSFVMSNFSYCPLVWHFCGKKNNSKIEKIQERALRIVCDDYTSTYQELISKVGTTTVLQSRINCILLEVFKSINHTNPKYIQDMIDITNSPYDYRNSIKLIQPKKKTKQILACAPSIIWHRNCGMTSFLNSNTSKILILRNLEFSLDSGGALTMRVYTNSMCDLLKCHKFIFLLHICKEYCT